jgi:hypothetical protein
MQIMHTRIERITIGTQNQGLPQFVFVFLQNKKINMIIKLSILC